MNPGVTRLAWLLAHQVLGELQETVARMTFDGLLDERKRGGSADSGIGSTDGSQVSPPMLNSTQGWLPAPPTWMPSPMSMPGTYMPYWNPPSASTASATLQPSASWDEMAFAHNMAYVSRAIIAGLGGAPMSDGATHHHPPVPGVVGPLEHSSLAPSAQVSAPTPGNPAASVQPQPGPYYWRQAQAQHYLQPQFGHPHPHPQPHFGQPQLQPQLQPHFGQPQPQPQPQPQFQSQYQPPLPFIQPPTQVHQLLAQGQMQQQLLQLQQQESYHRQQVELALRQGQLHASQSSRAVPGPPKEGPFVVSASHS
jgi:hypothetical protein